MLQRLTTWLWYGIVLLIVLLAVYSSLGRLLLGNLGQYRADFLRELNARADFVLEVDELKGSWRSLSPRVEARGVRVLGNAHAPVGLTFDAVALELDVLDTLLALSPRLYTLTASGGRIHVDIDADGKFSLAGIPGAGKGDLGSTLNDFLFNAESLNLDEMAIEVHRADSHRVAFVEATLQRDGAFRRFLLSLRAPDRASWFRLTAEGEGELSNYDRFDGLFHLQSSVGKLGAYRDVLALTGLEPTDGAIEGDVWLRLNRGELEVATSLDGRDIKLDSESDELPPVLIDRAAVIAAARYRDGRWNFRARDLNLQGGDEQIAIDRLVGSSGGRSLTLRMANLRLGELSSYLERVGLLPETAAAVLGKLSPRGRLERVEFALDDIDNLEQWRLSTNFSEVDVNPWKGAPGLTNAAGYADINASGGRVQLASSDFSMSFPAVYREPLSYGAFRAELEWLVEEEAFRIRSGPFTGVAEEGEVRGLFALKLPRVEAPAGSEMDLLVALRNTSPDYRRKYLPYKLNQNLLDWLEPSIGDGAISEGGFIYRGSLVKRPEHRTLQLFFDIEKTHIDYHPDWPALRELEGLVLIDDADVDVYGKRGRVLDTEVRDIRARIRSDENKKLSLDLEAATRGPAGDGLEVVNTSPLRARVGGAFEGWTLSGELATRLKLSMNLSDRSETPTVELWTGWSDVDVDFGKLNLLVENSGGELRYTTAAGFAADSITGGLWGEQMIGRVSQTLEDSGPGEIDIALTGDVAVDDIGQWLNLEVLELARGRTTVDLHILAPPGGGVRLEAESTLEGVALDLPAPWSKSQAEQRSMTLTMPLTGTTRQLELAMDDAAFLTLNIGTPGMTGGALGFGSPAAPSREGEFLLDGQIARLDWSEWQSFVDRHLTTGEPRAAPLKTVIDTLSIGKLVLFGRDFENVVLSGRQGDGGWHFDFSTTWAAGGVDIPDDLSLVAIDLSLLDLDVASTYLGDQRSDAAEQEPTYPALSINVSDLRQGERSWGNLSFRLDQEDANLHFSEVRGNLRNLQLGGEEGIRLDWLRTETGERTRLAGTLGFLDFGDVLADYQYEKIVETESGRVEVDLHWPGSPLDYALKSSSGGMTLNVQEGSFLKTPGAAEGTLRVVGILNLADFVRRLSLDLSHVYKAGVPFDTIEGELTFQEGLIEVPRMDVRGRTSRFQFVGIADAWQSTVEGELVATLPIASNLPWMFALVSGLPAAAGVYVISKLFDKQMDRFSSAVYSVKGPWADPQVEFERIFDDEAKDDIIQTAETAETVDDPGDSQEPET